MDSSNLPFKISLIILYILTHLGGLAVYCSRKSRSQAYSRLDFRLNFALYTILISFSFRCTALKAESFRATICVQILETKYAKVVLTTSDGSCRLKSFNLSQICFQYYNLNKYGKLYRHHLTRKL